MTRDGITYEMGLPTWATFYDIREVTTELSPTKSQLELVRELQEEIHIQALQREVRPGTVFVAGLRMRRYGQTGIQAYTQVVFA